MGGAIGTVSGELYFRYKQSSDFECEDPFKFESTSRRTLPKNWENLDKWTWDEYMDNLKKFPEKIQKMELSGNKI